MGQAASMCRFRGCRYKKNKNSNNNNSNNNCVSNNNSNNNNNINCSGLQLRSIEEPQINQQHSHHHHHHHQQHNQQQQTQQLLQYQLQNQQQQGQIGLHTQNSNNRMPSEQGGTGSGLENFGSRSSVPLQLQMLPSSQQRYDAEYARMEAWMDENPEFVQDYFLRKATRQVVDAWLVSHATSAGNDIVGSPTHNNGQQNCSSRGGSGATTPVRKISAHEFERGGLVKPIVNTIDGTPTFLSIGFHHNHHHHYNNNSSSSNNSNNHHYGYHYCQNNDCTVNNQNYNTSNSSNSGSYNNSNINNSCNVTNCNCHHNMITGALNRPQRLSRNELKHLDEKELIFELVKDICDDLDIRSLCHKILQNVSILLNADRGSLFLVQSKCDGLKGVSKKCLVSKLFDVCPKSTVEEMENQHEVRVAWGTGIAGHVAESGEPVNIPDAYKDYRFNREIDTQTGYRTKALLCMPIKDSTGDVIGVAQVMNKLDGDSFTENDEKVFASYLQFCGIGLRNAQLYEKSQLEVKRNQVLLDLARMIFEEQSTIEHMVLRILTHMQSLIQCQRVQILLVHEASKGSFSRVFDFEANDLSEDELKSRTSPFESRFPINIGITGHVATTGETVNIPNAYEDGRFDPSVDESSTFKHKSILCMAIKNSLGQIIGVIQLINKFDDLSFTKNDENFVEAFAIFCGMGIHNTHMYEKAIIAMAKQSVTLEVLSYHASATMDDAQRLRKLKIPSSAHFQLHDFKFDDLHLDDDDTLKACLRMFLDLDFVERFHIEYEVLCRWLLSVKKNYRNVTYHNWRHAFNVAQMMFSILTATQWWKIFGEIECLALIIGCLCHDLDHRGTNNSFQIKASSPLARLYSTSTMEHHHFDQSLMILNSPGNQILSNLSSEDYSRVIYVLEDAILSTDLAVYFRKRGPFLNFVEEKPLGYWYDDEPRALLRAMSMTVCDLSAITKPWEIEKRIAELVTSEFFEQGDMEKEKLNITPIDIMNREKEDQLPMMQVGFIESICIPLYEAFAKLSDKLEPLVEGVRNNREHWLELAAKVQNSNKNVGTQSHDDHNDDDNNDEKDDDDEGSDNTTDSDNSTIQQKQQQSNSTKNHQTTSKRTKNNNNNSSKCYRSNQQQQQQQQQNNTENINNITTSAITINNNNNRTQINLENLNTNKKMEEINNRKNTQNTANAIRKISLYTSPELPITSNIPSNHQYYYNNNNNNNNNNSNNNNSNQKQLQQKEQQQQEINSTKDVYFYNRNCGYTLPDGKLNGKHHINSNNNNNNRNTINRQHYNSSPPQQQQELVSIDNYNTINTNCNSTQTTESDKIPKIVGKFGNIDTEYLYSKLNGNNSSNNNNNSIQTNGNCNGNLVNSIIVSSPITNTNQQHSTIATITPQQNIDNIILNKTNKLNNLIVINNDNNSNINNRILIQNCSDSSITGPPALSAINK